MRDAPTNDVVSKFYASSYSEFFYFAKNTRNYSSFDYTYILENLFVCIVKIINVG